MMIQALVPPNPKEFDIAISIFFCLAILATKSISQFSEGLSKFKVGGAILSLIAKREKIASTLPAAPSKWPMADLVEDIESL